MVKGEADIVREWVIYHGTMFGFHNIFVIDNLSRDGTWEILQEFNRESRDFAKVNVVNSTLQQFPRILTHYCLARQSL